MKILHTSDWHIGRSLYGRKRTAEFEGFFDWLIETVRSEGVDVLLVAGDIFDSGTPSNQAQAIYYHFLSRVAATCCRHVVIIAGNHDSPSLLNAPQGLLRALNVHVVGSMTESPADEIVLLGDAHERPRLIVCAVPYLRDRDIRRAEAGETMEAKDGKLVQGIRDHYRLVAAAAVALASAQSAAGEKIPILAMGHLFTSGGHTGEGDGVRELYVGSLGQVRADLLPDCFDYLALGHLHGAQRVMGSELRRYSGAPLPMSFGEAGHKKIVLLLTVDGQGSGIRVEEKPVPCFQRLATAAGDWETIRSKIAVLHGEAVPIWLEVLYQGGELVTDLQERVRELTADTLLEVLRIKDLRLAASALSSDGEETLDDLEVGDVFGRCLLAHQVPPEQKEELIALFEETMAALHDGDRDDAIAGDGA
jgi:DNA repair protein SbcD/Mre11